MRSFQLKMTSLFLIRESDWLTDDGGVWRRRPLVGKGWHQHFVSFLLSNVSWLSVQQLHWTTASVDLEEEDRGEGNNSQSVRKILPRPVGVVAVPDQREAAPGRLSGPPLYYGTIIID